MNKENFVIDIHRKIENICLEYTLLKLIYRVPKALIIGDVFIGRFWATMKCEKSYILQLLNSCQLVSLSRVHRIMITLIKFIHPREFLFNEIYLKAVK